MKIDIKSIICTAAATLIMLTFFVVKTLGVFDIITHTQSVDVFEYISVILFMPFFFYLGWQVYNNNRKERINRKALQDILDDSCLVSRADTKGKITYVNEMFCKISGYKQHELLGKDHSVLNSGKHPKEFWLDMYTTTVKYKSIWHEVITNKNKKGEYYVVSSWIMAEFDENGKHTGYLSVRQDITELVDSLEMVDKKSREVENVLDAINKSNAVIEFCSEGRICNANQNFLDIMGYTLQEIKGKHHSMFVDEKVKLSKAYENFWIKLNEGKFQSGDYVRYNKLGEKVYIHGTYNPIMEKGKLVKVLKIVTDITESVLQKQEIERKNAYLEHAAKILRHDMHSGINTYIPRGLSSLKRRISDEKIKELRLESPLKMLEEGLKHAQKVYNGVKEFTNLVKKDAVLEKEFLDLNLILKNYLSSTSYKSQVKIDELPSLEVNESLFCTAVDNLIRNGLKYNDSSTKSVHIYHKGDYLIVDDNGRGMTKEQFRLFSQPYTRGENQKEGGSGLGLNICISILREHGFEIDCVKLKQGTRLKIKIQ